ncbi:hypothetical protein Z517_09223 [Fonsecaea pedrosoi CBS 271.37]|uniref:Uncharacterized protein n=1 Tax=Fonsecaea pedrosoi CBS 271.37 TaxID=1442368 RepID=A0A0D2GWN7_9EURO|nr:uncharacterized protein Z517_09223 [Fonsecaea pedrosoi CBS 271.37]KIW76779.1 hypothetical protein Z517_09223 [Fonsecaea pedrosoi CBS 271.37]
MGVAYFATTPAKPHGYFLSFTSILEPICAKTFGAKPKCLRVRSHIVVLFEWTLRRKQDAGKDKTSSKGSTPGSSTPRIRVAPKAKYAVAAVSTIPAIIFKDGTRYFSCTPSSRSAPDDSIRGKRRNREKRVRRRRVWAVVHFFIVCGDVLDSFPAYTVFARKPISSTTSIFVQHRECVDDPGELEGPAVLSDSLDEL